MPNKEIAERYAYGEDRLLQESGRINLLQLREMIKNNRDLFNLGDTRNDWDDTKKSRLIESFIMNLPVPPLIFSEAEYHKYLVLDGRQRIKTIANYLDGKFALKGLEIVYFKGYKYDDLPTRVQRILSNCSITYINVASNIANLNPEEISTFLEYVADRYK